MDQTLRIDHRAPDPVHALHPSPAQHEDGGVTAWIRAHRASIEHVADAAKAA